MPLLQALLALIPRFQTERYAVRRIGFSDLFDLVDLQAQCDLLGLQYDGVADYTSLHWCGLRFFARQRGPIRPRLWSAAE